MIQSGRYGRLPRLVEAAPLAGISRAANGQLNAICPLKMTVTDALLWHDTYLDSRAIVDMADAAAQVPATCLRCDILEPGKVFPDLVSHGR
jgi:hypothetical protein